MPAPHNPNTAAATATVRRRGDRTAAERLRNHGWTVVPPADYPEDLREDNAVSVTVISFGYGHGDPPVTAALVIDTRANLRNPHHDPAMRELTGLDQQVYDHVMATPGARELATAVALGVAPLARFRQESVEVAIGCVGGRHRSVALAEAIAAGLRRDGVPAQAEHRDVNRDVLPSTRH
jgi:UPF0042 nucleotide-binding protein